jgi:hypothetical protein
VYDLPAVTPYGVWNYYDTRGRRHGSHTSSCASCSPDLALLNAPAGVGAPAAVGAACVAAVTQWLTAPATGEPRERRSMTGVWLVYIEKKDDVNV